MYIKGIQYTDESLYTTVRATRQTTDTTFVSVLNDEICIYATPESAGVQSATTNHTTTSAPGTVPEQLESIFEKASEQYGVSKSLLIAVAKAESNFQTNCVSSAGAIGVMQLMPSTAASLGVSNPYDATENIMGGAKLLSQLLEKYNGNTSLALAAYNAGSGNVDKYGGIPPFKETQNYVSKVLGYLDSYDALDESNNVYAIASADAIHSGTVYSVFATPATKG